MGNETGICRAGKLVEAHTASALFLWGLGAKQQPSSMMGVTVRGGKPAETTDKGQTLRLTVSSVLQWARRGGGGAEREGAAEVGQLLGWIAG